MAYAAVISLKQTIQRLLNSSHISIVSSSREILEFAYNEVISLQEVLKRLDDSGSSSDLMMDAALRSIPLLQILRTTFYTSEISPERSTLAYKLSVSIANILNTLDNSISSSYSSSKRLNDLDGQIREAVHEVEDFLEFSVSNQFLSQSESEGSSNVLSIDLEEVRQEIKSFAEKMKQMEKEYVKEEDDDDAAVSSISTDFGMKMVGLSDEYTKIKNHLLMPTRPYDSSVFSIVGMEGTGRTFIADNIFQDLTLRLKHSVDCGAWVTIGPNYQFKEILLSMVAQIDPSIDELLKSEGDEEIAEYLHTTLLDRRYMIVLDDVWDTRVWNYLRRSFPKQDNGSVVLLTTCLKEVALSAPSFYIWEMVPLNDDTMWDLFHWEMFDEEPCPPQLEEAEKKIAENCKGLRFALIKVVLHLCKAEKTPEYWNEVAANGENPIFSVDAEMSEVHKIIEELQPDISSPSDDKLLFKLLRILFSSEIEAMKKQMFPERFFPTMKTISIVGMAGMGKTKLVQEIFDDPSVLRHFDHCAMVTLGPKYQSTKILIEVLAQIYPDIDKMHMEGDTELVDKLSAKLSGKTCLIVLDDLWNQEALHYLKRLSQYFKGMVLVTTRLAKVAQVGELDIVYEIPFLDKEESWYLFRQKVFGNESCSPQLEKVGKKIAENCGGLPLLILTVADILSKAEKTPEYWNKVLEKKNSVFMNAHNETSKILLPSYMHLPQHLKACFLYMGVFPQNSKIPRSKLINMWNAEGFLEPNTSQTVEAFVAECLMELVNRSLVMVHQKGSNSETKTCILHSVFWHLSNSEAMTNKFFHAFNTYADNLTESIKNQRRLCIRNSILMGIKDVHDLVASISSGRSLLCSGPSNKYEVPVYLGWRLLRVLDALIVYFYKFPIEVLKLIHIRYLALTCNGKLPISISKLWNLQYLIVSRQMSIEPSEENLLYLPVEIWEMKELKHLQVMGSTLPNPNCGALLPNLLTLLDVSAHSCTKRVLKRMPNLKRLRVQIVLAPNYNGNPFRCLNRISCLRRLESLKCVVVNPELSFDFFVPPAPRSMFLSSLKKLSLSGFGYPWEYMSIIGKLPNLEVLKLQCYAFRGPEWETSYSDFKKVKFLLIEDTDLVRWRNKLWSFINLEHLIIRHCYKLKEFPKDCFFNMVEVVDCNPLIVTWAKDMKEWYLKSPISSRTPELHLQSSWDARKLK